MPIDLNEGVDAQFKVQRQRAAQGEAGQVARQKDALARRAAQLGGGPSGALIKQEGIAQDQSAQRLQSANEGIDAAQVGEQRRIREIQQGQEFVHGERLGSQDWQSGESAIARKYGTSEREAGQLFTTSERLGSQDFSEKTRVNQNIFAHQESAAAADEARHNQIVAINAAAAEGRLTRDQANVALAQAQNQFEQTLAEEKRVNTHNMNQKDPLERALGRVSLVPGQNEKSVFSRGKSAISRRFG